MNVCSYTSECVHVIHQWNWEDKITLIILSNAKKNHSKGQGIFEPLFKQNSGKKKEDLFYEEKGIHFLLYDIHRIFIYLQSYSLNVVKITHE